MAGSGGKRKRRTWSQWQQLVRRQADSGLSVRDWCQKHQVTPSAFYRWRVRCGRLPTERHRRTQATFVPVQVRADEQAGLPGRIDILLGDGRQVRLSGPVDRVLLADILRLLERPTLDRQGPTRWRPSVDWQGRSC